MARAWAAALLLLPSLAAAGSSSRAAPAAHAAGSPADSERALALWGRELDLRERELNLRRPAGATGLPAGMSSFGVAIKHGRGCGPDEQTLFEHNLSTTAMHGVITQMWHGGTHGDPRMCVYVDEEIGTGRAAVDYTVSLVHGLAPAENRTWPWQSELFGRTLIMGFFNTYQMPFQKSVRITIQCEANGPNTLSAGSCTPTLCCSPRAWCCSGNRMTKAWHWTKQACRSLATTCPRAVDGRRIRASPQPRSQRVTAPKGWCR